MVIYSFYEREPYLLQYNIWYWGGVDPGFMELAYVIWGLLSKKKNTKLKTENYPGGTTSEGPRSFPVSASLNYLRAKTTSYISEFQSCRVLGIPQAFGTCWFYPLQKQTKDLTMRLNSKPSCGPFKWDKINLNCSIHYTLNDSLN